MIIMEICNLWNFFFFLNLCIAMSFKWAHLLSFFFLFFFPFFPVGRWGISGKGGRGWDGIRCSLRCSSSELCDTLYKIKYVIFWAFGPDYVLQNQKKVKYTILIVNKKLTIYDFIWYKYWYNKLYICDNLFLWFFPFGSQNWNYTFYQILFYVISCTVSLFIFSNQAWAWAPQEITLCLDKLILNSKQLIIKKFLR